MHLDIRIREIKPSENPQLEVFLYEAIYIPDGHEKIDKEIIRLPELWRYIKDFGQENDICLVAETDNQLIGAIWTRIYPTNERGYGYVDSETPELSMSVLKEYQRKGVGTGLLKKMMDKLKEHEFEQVSLSVDLQNYAVRLYQKIGFVISESDGKSAIMIKKLKEQINSEEGMVL